MTTGSDLPTCFIAMPITVHDDEKTLYGDVTHWAHVMDLLFIPAIKAAGYEPIVPSASGTSMIHARIVKQLVEADLVLCDLSQHNPNVMFELGVRTSLNKPVTLVKDEHLALPFDIQGLNTHHYASNLHAWELESEVDKLAAHIRDTETDAGATNPLWDHFGIALTATEPAANGNPVDAQIQLMFEQMNRLEQLTNRALHNSGMPNQLSALHSALISDGSGQVQLNALRNRVVDLIFAATPEVGPLASGRSELGDENVTVHTPPSDPTEQSGRAIRIIETLSMAGITATLRRSTSTQIEFDITE